MDSETEKILETLEEQEQRNPNRGMSKKEKRRVEALRQQLEPRFKKLEEESMQKISSIKTVSEKINEEGLSTERTDALENEKQEARSQQGENAQRNDEKGTPIGKLVGALQAAGLGEDPAALKLVAELAAMDPRNWKPKASHLIQPSGGGVPSAPDLRAEYERRVNELRPGDIDGLMEVKREFRRRGMEVW